MFIFIIATQNNLLLQHKIFFTLNKKIYQ